MKLSSRMRSVRPSATVAIADRSRALQAEGKPVISLSTGEPDFHTPAAIKQAAISAILAGETRYTVVSGSPALKAAVIGKLKRENDLDFAPNQIIVGCGGKQVIFNALLATLDAGDEVIIPAPYWVSYPDMVRLAGGEPVVVSTKQEQQFVLDANTLAANITERTRWLILNSPGNPTGAVYSAKELSAIADVLRRYPNVCVLCDDIYEYLVYDDNCFTTLLNVAPDLADRVLICNGVSKGYAMTGWRIGYGAGPAELITAMATLQSQSTTNASSVSQAAATAALTQPMDYLPEWLEVFSARRQLCMDILGAAPGLDPFLPAGAFYIFVNCDGLIGLKRPDGGLINDDGDLALYLLDIAQVAVVPGSAFGAPGNFRISFATDTEQLTLACQRIASAVEQLG